MPEHLTPLEPDHFYHVYNHAVGDELFFKGQDDYYFFLMQLKKYLLPFYDVFGYALMPNHFHLILNSHEPKAIQETLETYYKCKEGPYKSTEGKANRDSIVLYQSLSNFFNSYAKHYNHSHNRKGTIFTRSFRRKLIDSDTYLQDLIKYVHLNPVKANISPKPGQWEFSSYNEIIGTLETFIQRDRVIELFSDLTNFKACHDIQIINLEDL